MTAGESAEPRLADRPSSELLRAVARRTDPASTGKLDQLAAKVRDGDALLRLAQEHRMSAMLFARLQEASVPIPAGVEQQLKAEWQRNAFHSLTNTAELIDLLRAFDRERIPAMPIKGVVLAASAYGNLTTRPAGDLDILIEFAHLKRASAVMLDRGYKLNTPVRSDGIPVFKDNRQYEFQRQTDGLLVELHWRIDYVFGKFRRKLDLDWASRGRRTALLAGAEVPDMGPELTLLLLCTHGSKHVWPRLIWICDVAQVIDSNPALDWSETIREGKRSGLWRALALGVLLAHRVAGANVPEAALRRFESDGVACSLARQIDQDLFDSPGCPPKGRVPYNIKLLSLRDRILLIPTLDFLRPNEKDFAAVSLPRALGFLYWLVHPIRILRNLATGK